MNFQELKEAILAKAKEANACSKEYRRAANAETIEQLIGVIKDNLSFVRANNIMTAKMGCDYESPELFNSGTENTGLFNSGNRNSGDLNSGYRNSGVFCTRKQRDTIPFFNKDSDMTWDDWYEHPAYHISHSLSITEWVEWDDMTEDQKKQHPEAHTCGG